MKKIILAATGEELEWRNDADGDPCLVRKTDVGVPRTTLPLAQIVVAAYGRRTGSHLCWQHLSEDGVTGGWWESVESIEDVLVSREILRIEDADAIPQPGPTMEEYLIGEARAIILDAARNNFDHKRALRFIADSESM